MLPRSLDWLKRRRPLYGRRPPLVLINGLAEQAESWFCNIEAWRRHFDVYPPNLLAYEGAGLHERIDEGKPISVDYLVEKLLLYLWEFVQRPPYHLVANSMGAKVAVEFAVRYPDQVARLVLLSPSGMSPDERLPVVEGVRRNDLDALINSVFFDTRVVNRQLTEYYRRQFTSRRWRTGLLHILRGTRGHCVRHRLAQVTQPTLLLVGRNDRIVDPERAIAAAGLLPRGRLLVLPHCGHAPQMERPEVVNRQVIDFLTDPFPVPETGSMTSRTPTPSLAP